MTRTELATPTRRKILRGMTTAIAAATCPILSGCTQTPRHAIRPSFRNSLSVSPFADSVVQQGIGFHADGNTARTVSELQQLFMSQGSSEIFARMGTRLEGRKGRGFPLAIRYAELAKQLNISLNPELLLCAEYGDESGQPEPDFSDYPEIQLSKPWGALSIDEICDALRSYGTIKSRMLLDTGASINVWDIGNEVDCGMAGVALPPMNPRLGGGRWQYGARTGTLWGPRDFASKYCKSL